MAKSRESMQYTLKARALANIKNSNTVRAYKRAIREFVDYAKGTLGKHRAAELTAADVQAYADALERHGYSPATIHTKLAAVCRGTGVPMADIRKPKRKAGAITRSRMSEANLQGKRESAKVKNSRLVEVQDAIGCRRAELKRLTRGDIQRRQDGFLYAHIRRGKGGKEQWQRILPGDEKAVLGTLSGLKNGDRLFTDADMANKIDLHGRRAAHARQCYDYYAQALADDPSERGAFITDLMSTFDEGNRRLREENPAAFWAKRRRFYAELSDPSPYKLRGDNRRRALAEGRRVEYDRLPLMMVSVFHLAHWRLDVTVSHYML